MINFPCHKIQNKIISTHIYMYSLVNNFKYKSYYIPDIS